jgi:hypothetical protein
MNLKEAFRYQNKIQALIDEIQGILTNESNITKVESTHLRHKVMAEAKDETIRTQPESEYYNEINGLVRFMLFLLGEKEKLFEAVGKAKESLPIDLDSEVSLNALRQSAARTLRRMNDLRGSETIIANGGTGFRFNADGNQVTYRCDVKKVVTINYDRNMVKKELAKLNTRSDETSAKLDVCLVTSRVDYEPPFDVNSSFAEAFESFTGGRA